MTSTSTPEMVRILQAQEMKGERIVNHIRLCFTLLSLLMLAQAWSVNTSRASWIFAIQLGSWLVYSLALYGFFWARPNAYAGWLKYVSIFVDLGLLTLSAAAMAKNHSGVIEYMTGFVPVVYVFFNLLSAFRYSLAACLYSAALSLTFNAIVLAAVVSTGAIRISEDSVYGQNAINIVDQTMQILFIALPAIVGGIIARISRELVLRAETESRERVRLEHEKQQLGRYLSQDLISFVLAEPGRLKLGGTRRHVSVMFTDIRNFTPLTESVEPEVVVSFLNEYFTTMVDIVFRYGGTLDKYIGDGLMAVFGAPFTVDYAPGRAVLAAIEMVHALERFNERQRLVFGDIRMGVGIATGTVVLGNIGSNQRMEFTCIGDTVNTASRLEQINKELGSSIVVCQSTFEALGNSIPAHPAEGATIRGKSRDVRPYVVEHEQISRERVEELRRRLLEAPPRVDSLPPRADLSPVSAPRASALDPPGA
ncbi:MAG: adenylate/guanylate cyclase domain-containing protein [Polyangiaceae bacterium]|nr:adenylate/guanylate cyclase domain-containing protein [Polyangiaceae bacterium]